MKLSEAIRLGIGVVRNDKRTFGYYDSSGTPCGCAVTTALVAIGKFDMIETQTLGSSVLQKYWPWTKREGILTPGLPVSMEISHMHYCGKSREDIADWVATIEPQEPTQEEVSYETERSYSIG